MLAELELLTPVDSGTEDAGMLTELELLTALTIDDGAEYAAMLAELLRPVDSGTECEGAE